VLPGGIYTVSGLGQAGRLERLLSNQRLLGQADIQRADTTLSFAG
jgi:hypothetical protein